MCERLARSQSFAHVEKRKASLCELPDFGAAAPAPTRSLSPCPGPHVRSEVNFASPVANPARHWREGRSRAPPFSPFVPCRLSCFVLFTARVAQCGEATRPRSPPTGRRGCTQCLPVLHQCSVSASFHPISGSDANLISTFPRRLLSARALCPSHHAKRTPSSPLSLPLPRARAQWPCSSRRALPAPA